MPDLIATLKTLSPIHIGDGVTYSPIEYLVINDTFYYIPYDVLASIFTEEDRNKFIEYIEKPGRPSLNKSFSVKPKLDKVCKNAAYQIECFHQEMNQVRSFIKTKGKVYIPGSEIKGALRTAILYGGLRDSSYYNWLINEIKKIGLPYLFSVDIGYQTDLNNKQVSKELRKEFQEKERPLSHNASVEIQNRDKWTIKDNKNLYYVIKQENTLNIHIFSRNFKEIKELESQMQERLLWIRDKRHLKKREAGDDLLKFLQIADSEPKEINKETMSIGKVKVYNTGEQRTPYAEFIKEGVAFAVTQFLQVQYSTKLTKTLTSLRYEHDGYKKDRLDMLDHKELLKFCWLFSKDLLEVEKEHFAEDQEVLNKLEDIEKENTPDSPVIKLGAYNGFFHTTISLLIRKQHPDIIKDIVRRWTTGTTYNDFPKTYRDVKCGNQRYPIGWVKIVSHKTTNVKQ